MSGHVSTLGMSFLGLLGLVATGCGDSGSDAECSMSGTACMWAGIGERGYNIENPTAHRLKSKLYYPEDVTFDSEDRGYIVDWNNHRIRRVEKDDSLVDVIGTDYEGDGPPEMEDRLPTCNPAGAPGLTVALNHMTDVEFGPDGRLYMAAWHNNKIRIWDPATDLVTAFGNGYGYAGDGDLACNVLFNQPKAIVFGPDGTLYTIDQRNVRIRAITGILEDENQARIDTIAGTGAVGNVGDGGLAANAQFGFENGTTPRPAGALVWHQNKLLVADSLNNRIRSIDMSTGMIDCIAGREDGQPGYSGDGGNALDATFNFPSDMELGPDGRLYVADRGNHAIRAIDLQTGTIETVAGTGVKCELEDGEDCPVGRAATEVPLNEPYGVAFDSVGNMYVADTHNNRILKVAR